MKLSIPAVMLPQMCTQLLRSVCQANASHGAFPLTEFKRAAKDGVL